MGSITCTWPGKLSASVSTSAKNSSGSFTVSARITNISSAEIIANCRVSCSVTNGSPWSAINVGTLQTGASSSGSVTISTGDTSGCTVYCYVLYGSQSSGYGGGCSVDGYVDPTPPTPTMSPITLAITPTTQTMGQVITITESGGYYCTVRNRNIQVQQDGSWTTVANYTSGNYTIPTSVFEPYSPGESVDVRFYAYCVASSGAQGSGNSNMVTVTLTVPSDYKGTATNTYTPLRTINNAMVAGQSGLSVDVYPESYPDGNSATITDVNLTQILPEGSPVTTSMFTKTVDQYGTYNFTTGNNNLPSASGVPSYMFGMMFTITDSRGRTNTFVATGTDGNQFRVSTFVPPFVQITSIDRLTNTTGKLELTIEGESTSNPSRIDSTANTIATVKVGDEAEAEDVKSQLVQTEKGYTLTYNMSGLNDGSQYTIYFVYRDTTMNTYGELAYTYRTTLSTMSMPLSLFDNGSRIAASFGEACADNYGQNCVINFAKDSYIRYIKPVSGIDTVVIDKPANLFSSCPYNVGDIYITTLSSDPSTIWSGTTWEQLEDMFLLGAGSTYTAGDTGGEAEHTLTIEEMPSHTHSYYNNLDNSCNRSKTDDLKTTGVENGYAHVTGSTGGDQAHNNMPPYLVVNMWKRLT